MIFPQHIPLPQMDTFSMTETDQLQYDTPPGDYLQANPLPMNLARPDMDMLMQDIDISIGLFYVDQVETLQGSMEARLAVSPIYLSSIGSLPFCFLFIHHCFGVLYDLYDRKLSRPPSLYISSFFSAGTSPLCVYHALKLVL
jgi:hypothetical protein